MEGKRKSCDHIIFLIHPLCYEKLDAQTVQRYNYHLFVEREKEVKHRWLSALAARPKDTLYIQLEGPEYLFQNARELLGNEYAFSPRATFDKDQPIQSYYRQLAQAVLDHVERSGLRMDASAVSSELWGESFEGCVPGYGGAFAEYLNIGQSPRMRFEMTVYDSRFLYAAKRWRAIPIGESDVEAWVFECYDGTGAAMFQSRLRAQWVDDRVVHLKLDTRRNHVCTKQGHTVWPQEPWKKGSREDTCDYPMTLSECNWRWIRSIEMTFDDLLKVIGEGTVREGEGAAQAGPGDVGGCEDRKR